VRADKEREAKNGHDGTWVAHPDLVAVAREVFDALMPTANQLYAKREDVHVGQKELLELHEGTKTEAGFRENIRVGVQYIEAWLRGRGAVPIYNLMEDAATAEISRSQVWQWIHHGATLNTGQRITRELVQELEGEELDKIREAIAVGNRLDEARAIFDEVALSEQFVEFLTLPAYAHIE
jgi:malate synthase